MTKSTITRERLEKIKSWRETYGAGSNVILPAEEAAELASIALAAMDSEPVAWMSKGGTVLNGMRQSAHDFAHYNIPLYRHAQPAPLVPEEIPGSVYEVIYQECGGFVDCDANAQTIWNACRSAMLAAAPQEAKTGRKK